MLLNKTKHYLHHGISSVCFLCLACFDYFIVMGSKFIQWSMGICCTHTVHIQCTHTHVLCVYYSDTKSLLIAITYKIMHCIVHSMYMLVTLNKSPIANHHFHFKYWNKWNQYRSLIHSRWMSSSTTYSHSAD